MAAHGVAAGDRTRASRTCAGCGPDIGDASAAPRSANGSRCCCRCATRRPRVGLPAVRCSPDAGVPDLEVLVLDDGSTDGTARRRAHGRGGRRPRVRLLAGPTLPPGWLGKPWACAQLAGGGHRHRARLRRRRRRARAARASPRRCAAARAPGSTWSAPYPRQLAETVAERLVQPLLQWSWLTTLPLRPGRGSRAAVARGRQRPAARGRRATRTAAPAATRAVRAEVLDDIALLRAVKRGGGRGDGRRRHRPRHLPDVRRLGRRCATGYAKSLWAAFGSPAGAAAVAPGSSRLVYVAAAARRAARLAGRGWLGLRRRRSPAGRWSRGARRAGVAGRARPPGVGRLRSAGSPPTRWRRQRRGPLTLEGPRRCEPGESRVARRGDRRGMGGLAVAARLAAQGHDVTVLEQAADVGGKLGVVARDGFAFDTGPVLLTLPAVYRDLFLKTGEPRSRTTSSSSRSTRSATTGSPTAPGSTSRTRPAPASRAALDEALGGRRRRALDRASWTAPGAIWQVTRGPFLAATARRRAHAARGWRRRPRPADRRPVAVAARARPQLPARPAAAARCWTATRPTPAPTRAGRPPRSPSSRTSSRRSAPGTSRGGLRRLGDALHARCVERGVVVPLRRAASRGRCSTAAGVGGVRLADGERRAGRRRRVATPTPPHVYADLLPAARPTAARARRCAARRRRCPGFVLLLALRGRTPGLRTTRCCSPRTTTTSSTRCSARPPARRSTDPTVYVSAPDDPALRPDDDSESWFVLVNAPPHARGAPRGRRVDWDAPGLRRPYADRVLDVMAEPRPRRARPGAVARGAHARRPRARHRRAGRVDLRHVVATVRARRSCARPTVRPVPGLFLVGGSAHPGGGLPLVGLSAEIVAGLVGRA